MRRFVIYQPLAILLSILLAPAVSWMEGSKNDRSARPFQAHAQVQSACVGVGNKIIRNYCDKVGIVYALDLLQLEDDAVKAYLGLHGLPPTDAHVIYDYGQSDLRNGVRATMLTTLLGIIAKPAASRTTHEQTLYTWLQNFVQANEITLYQEAVNHFQSFRSNPCHFALDPVLASAFKLTYDGTPFCFANLSMLDLGVRVPSKDYFTAYGLKKSYGAKADQDPNFASLVTGTALSAGGVWGIAASAGAVVSAIVAPAIFSSLAASLAVFNAAGAAAAAAIFNATAVVSGSTVSALGIGAAASGPLIIVFVTIAIGVAAGMQVFNDQKAIDDLNGMTVALNQVTNTPPDLKAFANDKSGLGLYKLQTTLVSQTVPEIASVAALPTHQAGTDLSFAVTPSPSGPTQIRDTLTYRDWSGNSRSAQTWGGWFVETCANGASSTCAQADGITGDLQYVDWSGVKWTAARLGTKFVSTKGSPALTDKACPADGNTGVSPGSNFSQCVSYVSTSIPMKDGSNNPITASFSLLEAPAFVAPASLSFSPGTPSTRTIVATGNPAPRIDWVSGLGGNHFSFFSRDNTFQLIFDGSLAATTGTFQLQLKASSSSGSVTQTFTVTVSPQLNIISPSTISGTAGFPLNFKVVATGNPTPALSLIGGGFDGLTFQDNGDGTGTLSGTYTSYPTTLTCIAGCGFVATNSQGTVTQHYTLVMDPAPSATLALPTSAYFTAGVANQVLLSSFGAITPVKWDFWGDSNAPWLTLQENGDGTATLSGTPPIQSSGTFTPALVPRALGTFAFLQNFPVTVGNEPVFTSPNTASFTVGTAGSFNITANAGTISASNNPPGGLSFAGGNPATLSGTPAAGTGGQYTLTLQDIIAAGSAQQSLTLNINEGPRFTSPKLVTLFAGKPASFGVDTIGYPSTSNHSMAGNSQPPANPSQGNGMYFTVSGLPSSLAATNLNAQGFATGILTVSGTPSSADVGSRKVQITAQNGVGAPAQHSLTLQILPFNPVTPVNLITTSVLSRDASNNVVATVVVANNGSAAAQNVAIPTAKIGAATGTVLPVSVASIGSASTATFTIMFPAASLGAAGSANVLSLSGTYTGGTFSNAARIVLP